MLEINIHLLFIIVSFGSFPEHTELIATIGRFMNQFFFSFQIVGGDGTLGRQIIVIHRKPKKMMGF